MQRALTATVVVLSLVIPGARVVRAQGRIRLPVGLSQLEGLARKDSNDAAAHYNVALGYWNARRYDDAERELHMAVSLEPRLAPAHLALAYLPFARRPRLWDEQFKRPLSDSLRAILDASDREERHAYLIDPLVNLAIIGATTPPKDPRWDMFEDTREFYETYYQAFDDLNQGKYEDAYRRFAALVNLYQEVVSRDPGNLPEEFIWFRGIAASHIARYQEALADFQTLLSRAENRERSDTSFHVPLRTNDFRYLLANVHQRAGNIDQAIGLYREALETDVGLYMAHVQLADLLDGQRQYAQAVGERRGAVNANPDDPSLLTDLGITLGKSGQFTEAVEVLAQAGEANPRDARPYFWLGLAQLQLDHRPEAKAAFTRFIEVAPTRYDRQIAMARQRLADLQ